MQSNLLKAQVVIVERERYFLESEKGLIQAKVSGRYHYTHVHKAEYPQVGDWVNYRLEIGDLAIIESVDERRSVLDRADVGSKQEKQILAVNIDKVFICISANKDFNLTKLRHFLLLTSKPELKPVILLTKRDLSDQLESYIDQIKEITDVDVYPISVYYSEDIEGLKELIENQTVVLIGASGVGKSTLINHLLDEEKLKTADIRDTDGQGRHTTVHRELIRINETTAVIDTPGIRIIGSYIIPENEFEDIISLGEGCYFSDCKHDGEPGCMVEKAIHEGVLDPGRFEMYLKTLKRNAYFKRREAQKKHKK
ncbi:MAG: ribosome small subunit-dependent GTPase A [Candidatus Izemoplasmatales bacterium]